jgi:hypothetical protein
MWRTESVKNNSADSLAEENLVVLFSFSHIIVALRLLIRSGQYRNIAMNNKAAKREYKLQ